MLAPELNKKHLKKDKECISQNVVYNKDEDNSLNTLNDKIIKLHLRNLDK